MKYHPLICKIGAPLLTLTEWAAVCGGIVGVALGSLYLCLWLGHRGHIWQIIGWILLGILFVAVAVMFSYMLGFVFYHHAKENYQRCKNYWGAGESE